MHTTPPTHTTQLTVCALPSGQALENLLSVGRSQHRDAVSLVPGETCHSPGYVSTLVFNYQQLLVMLGRHVLAPGVRPNAGGVSSDPAISCSNWLLRRYTLLGDVSRHNTRGSGRGRQLDVVSYFAYEYFCRQVRSLASCSDASTPYVNTNEWNVLQLANVEVGDACSDESLRSVFATQFLAFERCLEQREHLTGAQVVFGMDAASLRLQDACRVSLSAVQCHTKFHLLALLSLAPAFAVVVTDTAPVGGVHPAGGGPPSAEVDFLRPRCDIDYGLPCCTVPVAGALPTHQTMLHVVLHVVRCINGRCTTKCGPGECLCRSRGRHLPVTPVFLAPQVV